MSGISVLFIDRDGTLITEPDDFQVDSLDKLQLLPGVIPALRALIDDGYRLVMVSNQDGLGSNTFPQTDFEKPQQFLLSLLESQGITFDEIFVCPHRDEDNCDCRKPRTGLLTRYLADTPVDRSRSAVIGDRETDLALARNLGVRGITVSINGEYSTSWAGIRESLRPGARQARYARTTAETDIHIALDLDSSGPPEIDTGIAFFDHMLEQVARHGGIRLELRCRGDLDVDAHHTVEDTALALGAALREALGDKRGINRFGFLLPMDEAEAQLSLDLSGRPWLKFDGAFPAKAVGGLPTEMVPHFFRSFADALGATLHIAVAGDNSHHMVEACFKALGRTLREAVKRSDSGIPSTKGSL